MILPKVAYITFEDIGSGDAAFALVRSGEDRVVLAVSLAHDGDYQVVFDVTVATQLRDALTEAIAVVGRRSTS